MLQRQHRRHRSLVIVAIQLLGKLLGAAVADLWGRDTLVEVGRRECELDRPRSAGKWQGGQVARHRDHRDRAVVLDRIGAVGVAVDHDPLRALPLDGRDHGGEHPYMDKWWVPGLQIGYEHTFIHQVADFLAGLSDGKIPGPSFRDGLATDYVTDAVLKSAQTGRWEKVAAPTGRREESQTS